MLVIWYYQFWFRSNVQASSNIAKQTLEKTQALYAQHKFFNWKPIYQRMSLKPIQIPFSIVKVFLVHINPLIALTCNQVGSWSLPHTKWNLTTEFLNSPSFAVIDSGLIETFLYITWDFDIIPLRVVKYCFSRTNPVVFLAPWENTVIH